MYTILLIEDDEKISEIVDDHLKRFGYVTYLLQDFRKINDEVESIHPHLILLDINLPYFDGFYWCRQIRAKSNVPIIFISARTGDMDQVLAIENGGDDYITKPFHIDVAMAKIKSVLRRTYGEYAVQEQEYVSVNGLLLFPTQHAMQWKGLKVELTKNEYNLLECLVKKPNQYVTREELLEALWDEIAFVDDNTLTVNVKRVRKKLEELDIKQAIVTKRGYGYSFTTSWGDTVES